MEQKEVNTKSSAIHTFSDDMVGVLGENQSGAVRDLIAAEEEREKLRASISPESKQNQIFLIVGSLLLILSLASVAYVFLTKGTGAVTGASTYKPIIFSDQTRTLPVEGLGKDAVSNLIYGETVKSGLPSGRLEGIYLTENKQIINLQKLMSLIDSNIDPGAYELLGQNFSVGVVAAGNETRPYILITTNSFQRIFPIMRAWEGKMFYDLHGVFGIDLRPDTNYLLTADFTNGILQNKNARILYKQDGSIALAYVYLNDTNILITDSEKTVKEIVLRLASSQVAR